MYNKLTNHIFFESIQAQDAALNKRLLSNCKVIRHPISVPSTISHSSVLCFQLVSRFILSSRQLSKTPTDSASESFPYPLEFLGLSHGFCFLLNEAETEVWLLAYTCGLQRLLHPDRYWPVEVREIAPFNRVTGLEKPGWFPGA